IRLSDECSQVFKYLRGGKQYRYATFSLSPDEKTFEVETIGRSSATYKDFLADLPLDECRYGAYEFEYSNKGVPAFTLVIFHWYPLNASIRIKTIFGVYRPQFVKRMGLGDVVMEAREHKEISEKAVLEHCL
ncbi:MAG: hypothetical protein BYD32DRAFT_357508, partial [Podila humilis]